MRVHHRFLILALSVLLVRTVFGEGSPTTTTSQSINPSASDASVPSIQSAELAPPMAPAGSSPVVGTTAKPPLVSLPPLLNVGLAESPPFAFKVGDHWEGLSVDLWNQVAARHNIKVVFNPITGRELAGAFAAKKIDVGPINAITTRGVQTYTYTVPVISSNLSLVTLQQSHATWRATLRQFQKSGVVGVLLAILGLNFIVGLLLWLIERRSNAQQFGGNAGQGLGSAIWCAITTMMTVGYGDKVPITWLGRLLCFIVMLTGVVIISIFTATAGSAMTVARLETEVNSAADLRNVTCVALNHSTGGDYIRANGLRGLFVKSLDEAFDKLMHGEAAVLIHDKIRVESILKTESRGAIVLPLNLKEDYFAFSLPLNSTLKPNLDAAIEETLESDAWTHAQSNALGQ